MNRMRIKIASEWYPSKQMQSLVVSMEYVDVVTNMFVLKVEELALC